MGAFLKFLVRDLGKNFVFLFLIVFSTVPSGFILNAAADNFLGIPWEPLSWVLAIGSFLFFLILAFVVLFMRPSEEKQKKRLSLRERAAQREGHRK